MTNDVTPPPIPSHEPTKQPSRRHTTAIIIGSAALVATVTGAGFAINSSNHSQAKPAAISTSTRPTSTPSPDITQQFVDWRDSGGMDTLSTLSDDLSAVDKASHPVDFDGLRESCSTLTADVEAAQDGDPLPDKAIDKRWNLALEHLANSATACSQGAVGEDQASFDLMASEMDIGTKHLDAVLERVGKVLGS